MWEGDRVTGLDLLTTAPDSVAPPAWLQSIIKRVQRHLKAGNEDFADTPFDWDAVTSFQGRVYRAALQTSPGVTASYGKLAEAMGDTTASSRAVGSALGRNPWPLLVPCHRFVSSTGKLTGFSAPGGIETKLKLLNIEGCQLFAQ